MATSRDRDNALSPRPSRIHRIPEHLQDYELSYHTREPRLLLSNIYSCSNVFPALDYKNHTTSPRTLKTYMYVCTRHISREGDREQSWRAREEETNASSLNFEWQWPRCQHGEHSVINNEMKRKQYMWTVIIKQSSLFLCCFFRNIKQQQQFIFFSIRFIHCTSKLLKKLQTRSTTKIFDSIEL